MVDGNFMLTPTYRLVTVRGFDMSLTDFWFREKLQMAYHRPVLNVLICESRLLFHLSLIWLVNNIDAETYLRLFEMYHRTFHHKMVLRSKFAYEHIACSMFRVQKISCGSTGVKMRWIKMSLR